MKFNTKSLMRREEYKRLARVSIDGSILDVGGSTKSGYHELLKGTHTITTANIDASYGADVIFDAQETWPFPEGSFDAVLFINVLEHIYDYRATLSEGKRTLRKGGRVIGVVPFLFNVHGSPSDYFRYSRFAIEHMLTDTGFTEIEVEEIGTGAFSLIYHALIGFVRWKWMADILIPFFKALDRLVLFMKPNNLMSAKHMPLGYYFEARA